MNKRDLIKALFKNPTIKALYESGHFHASDINRAILTEASEENQSDADYLSQELRAEIRKLETEREKLETKIRHLRSVNRNQEAKPIVKERNAIDRQIEVLKQKIELLRQQSTMDAEISKAAEATPSKEDDAISQEVSLDFASRIDALTSRMKGAVKNIDADNASDTLRSADQSITQAIKATAPEIEKERDAVEAAKAGGEVDAGNAAKQVPDTKGWDRAKVSIRQRIKNRDLTIKQIRDSLKSVEEFKKLFGLKSGVEEKMAQAQKLFDDGWIAGEIKRLAEKAQQTQTPDAKNETTEETVQAAATVMSFYEFLQAKSQQEQQFQIPSGFKFPDSTPKSEEEFKQQFIAPLEKAAKEAPTSTTPQEQDYERIADDIIGKNEGLFAPEDLQVAGMRYFIGWYVSTVPEITSFEQLQEEVDLSGLGDPAKIQRIQKYQGENRENIFNHISANEDRWKDIFKKLDDIADAQRTETGLSRTQATDKQTDDLGAAQQQPDVESQTREQQQASAEQQQQEALQTIADPKADEDLSVLEQAEMDSAWKEQLDTFFGKNPEKSSFMRRLLLRDQASMLYSMIATLDKIIQGPRKKKEDELETGALTDQYDEDQPKQDNLKEQVINEVFSALFGKKEENEPVELSKESRGHMRQDLEAMVSLLRSLKEDIRGYSKYATRSSVDPRFDGSTLKKAMDAKLAVVQERIAMLTEQIKTSISQQDKQVAAAAAQELGEVMDLLSEADESDRRMKIKRVREVYEEMRRLYIDSLMTSLENNEPQKSKEGAKRIKDYVMEQEDFLGFFPSNIVSGGTVMTLGDAYESMKTIIGKFIDTIRDVVTITKTQNVSKESLALASRDLIGIAESIEKMFKIPSKIDSDFVKKYKEAAASEPSNQSITNEEPSENFMQKVSQAASDLAGKAADIAKDLIKPIKDLYDKITPTVSEKLNSLVTELSSVKDAISTFTGDSLQKFWEMLTTFFNKNMEKLKSTKQTEPEDVVDSEWKKAIEELPTAKTPETIPDQAPIADKSKLLPVYDKASPEVKSFMDTLPGKLGASFSSFVDQILKLVDYVKGSVKIPSLRAVALMLFLKFAKPQDVAGLEDKSMEDFNIDSSSLIAAEPPSQTSDTEPPSQASDTETGEPEDSSADSDEQIQKYTKNLSDSQFTKEVMRDIIGNKKIVGQMGKESIEAVASIIEIAKLIKNHPVELDESISKILNKVKTSANSMMNNRKAKSHFSEYKEPYERYFGPDGFEQAKKYIAFLLKFINGIHLHRFIQELSAAEGDIDVARRETKELRSMDEKPNPSKEAIPLPADVDQKDFYNRTPGSKTRNESLEKTLKPIIEKMLKEHYNY